MVRTFALVALVLAAFASPTNAAMIYSDSGSFFGGVQPGSFTNTFDGPFTPSPATFTGNGFSYTLSAPGGLYYSVSGPSGSFVGVNTAANTFTVTMNSGNINAVGG